MTKRNLAAVCFLVIVLVFSSSSVLAENYVLPSLREIYKDYFHIGGAISVASWAPKTLISHRDIILGQLSSLTAENAMKPDYLQPREGVFNFREPDNLVSFAKEHGMVVRGHTLVWHGQTPDWFFRDKNGQLIYEKDQITDEDRQLVISRMEAHIEAVMTHFGDDVYCWDVVNEAVSDNAAYIHRPESPWVRTIGEDFIKIAFRKAHEVNPNAKLFYNDYNAVAPYKRGRIHKLLTDLLAEGVPVHGIGIQGHWGVDGPSLADIEQSIKMYAELGLEIHITEMDIGMGDFTEEEQAERYRQVFELFKKYSDVITNVTLWGIADDASWRGDDDPLLFDRNHEPKPAFWAVVDTDKPWYVNKAEYTGAVIFKNAAGQIFGTLKPGEYKAADLSFSLADVARIEVGTGYMMSLYESEDRTGDAWHFVRTDLFDGANWPDKAKAIAIRTISAQNIALNKPVEASVLSERAHRAVDGAADTSWAPRATPPYWLSVDLQEPYLLYRWVCKLHGTGPLSRISHSPFNAADFILQVSEDGINWTDVDVVEDNTASTTERDLDLIKARYVRLFVTRPTSLEVNQNLVVYELELYGLPAE
ncbi:MAG TPA: endo-1,4-beta-xylanase [Limnochordia bacterium]|nr:endo-1,4-beta-xylanase [Limnochordia bacterium]